MKAEKTFIDGLLVIKPDVFKDERGYFFESFSNAKYYELGLLDSFVQDNISKSVKGTIRGLHYQIGDYAQGKLCQVISGNVLDVAVDIRFGSPTFGKHFAIELSDENNFQLWMPPGFAHGFSVLSEEAYFHYKCTAYYHKDSERSIIFDDPDLAVDWKVDASVISAKDKLSKKFSDIEEDFTYQK